MCPLTINAWLVEVLVVHPIRPQRGKQWVARAVVAPVCEVQPTHKGNHTPLLNRASLCLMLGLLVLVAAEPAGHREQQRDTLG